MEARFGEALWTCGIGGVESGLPSGAHGLDATVEDVGGRKKREARVVMLVVVPTEELLQPSAAVKWRCYLAVGRELRQILLA
jgi:hypothetical protein